MILQIRPVGCITHLASKYSISGLQSTHGGGGGYSRFSEFTGYYKEEPYSRLI